jgi:NADH-quinone oxidoreductase subunit M
MAILIAMYGRKDGPKAATKFFLFTFIPSAPLLVAILWLYAKTGTFDFAQLQMYVASGALPVAPLFWVALAFLFAFAVKVPIFPLHGWLADTFNEAPVAMAMVVAGKLGLYSMLRFHVGLFPAQARQIAPFVIALAVIGTEGFLAVPRVCCPRPPQSHRSRDLRIDFYRLGWRHLPNTQ